MNNASSRAGPPATLLAFASGLVFGIGLLVSGLTEPARVLAFLDVAGAWEASLLLTMGAAIVVGLGSFAIARRRRSTLIGLPLQLPTATTIDRRVVVGGLLFGVGWGLAGICPGPGFVVLGMGSPQAALFVGAMVIGMALFDVVDRRAAARATAPALPAPGRH